MTRTRLFRLVLSLVPFACQLPSTRADGDELAPAVQFADLRDQQSSAVIREAWEAAAPRFQRVGNWISMSAAQSTLPQGIFGGAELYFAQPRAGESVAFGTITDPEGNGPDILVRNFTFDFQASPKAYFGWRSPNTGDAVQFTYWHFDQSVSTGYTITEPFATAFIPFVDFNEQAVYFGLGDSISAARWLNFNVYDIDYLKSLAFNGGRWLVTGSVGGRIADVDQGVSSVVHLGSGELAEATGKDLNFTGGGPRLTLEGRRNFGPILALYARGGCALLFGTYDTWIYSDVRTPGGELMFIKDGRDRTVTTLETELGASWAPFSSLVLSGGYLFQSWDGLNDNFGAAIAIDGGQLTSFNGFVARAIYSY